MWRTGHDIEQNVVQMRLFCRQSVLAQSTHEGGRQTFASQFRALRLSTTVCWLALDDASRRVDDERE